jgi:hypothetical protein
MATLPSPSCLDGDVVTPDEARRLADDLDSIPPRRSVLLDTIRELADENEALRSVTKRLEEFARLLVEASTIEDSVPGIRKLAREALTVTDAERAVIDKLREDPK